MIADLPGVVAALLERSGGGITGLQSVLDEIADAFGAQTAALHAAEPTSDPLRPDLIAIVDRGLPEVVRAKTRRIPFGRGMAGVCVERRAPVSVCNLQTDESGVVRPGAKETGVAGAIVVPIFAADRQRVIGTLGVGVSGERDYSPEEQDVLLRCGAALAPALDAVALELSRN